MTRPGPPPIRIVFRLGEDGWTATSPDIDGLAAGPFADQGQCQHEAISRVREWARPGVMLDLSIAEDG